MNWRKTSEELPPILEDVFLATKGQREYLYYVGYLTSNHLWSLYSDDWMLDQFEYWCKIDEPKE